MPHTCCTTHCCLSRRRNAATTLKVGVQVLCIFHFSFAAASQMHPCCTMRDASNRNHAKPLRHKETAIISQAVVFRAANAVTHLSTAEQKKITDEQRHRLTLRYSRGQCQLACLSSYPSLSTTECSSTFVDVSGGLLICLGSRAYDLGSSASHERGLQAKSPKCPCP
jgi:hypothetical protein